LNEKIRYLQICGQKREHVVQNVLRHFEPTEGRPGLSCYCLCMKRLVDPILSLTGAAATALLLGLDRSE
jgi:hypothetical protein